MNKRWIHKTIPEKALVENLARSINVNPFLTAVLIQRGIHSFDQAKKFFRPSLQDLHDPFLMADMAKAVNRIQQAIEQQQHILIYGDYDVDGTTATALVYLYLKSFYPHCSVYIPDRNKEGYGVSREGVEWAANEGYSLVIALDCGIKASEMVNLAASKGVDFIICDHHLPDSEIPNAVAVLDPKRKDCAYPYKELSGCGLGFKLMQAYARQYRNEEEVFEYIDLVAVSIASDIVPITDENRVLAFFGLKKLNEAPLPGLKALKDLSGMRSDFDISGVVFSLGPRINAAGRVAHASAAVDLLTAPTEEEAMLLAEAVNNNNDTRKQFDADITEEALSMIENDERLRNSKSTVLYKETWHKGVIGIVAARCVEKYYRPTVILTQSNNKVTGSARSVNGFDLYQAIVGCSDLLEKFGGHKYAAGLTMDVNNVQAFQQRFEEVVTASITSDMLTPVIEIDLELPFDSINAKFLNILKQMAPFGPENQRPVFESKNVFVYNSLGTMKDRHIRFYAAQEGSETVLPVVGFDLAEFYEPLSEQRFFRMAYTVEENVYNGNTSIQLRLKDIKFD